MLQYLRRKKKITVCKIIFSQISDSLYPEHNIGCRIFGTPHLCLRFGVYSYIYVTRTWKLSSEQSPRMPGRDSNSGPTLRQAVVLTTSLYFSIVQLFQKHCVQDQLRTEMEAIEIMLAEVSRLCQLSSHSRGFLSRL